MTTFASNLVSFAKLPVIFSVSDTHFLTGSQKTGSHYRRELSRQLCSHFQNFWSIWTSCLSQVTICPSVASRLCQKNKKRCGHFHNDRSLGSSCSTDRSVILYADRSVNLNELNSTNLAKESLKIGHDQERTICAHRGGPIFTGQEHSSTSIQSVGEESLKPNKAIKSKKVSKKRPGPEEFQVHRLLRSPALGMFLLFFWLQIVAWGIRGTFQFQMSSFLATSWRHTTWVLQP